MIITGLRPARGRGERTRLYLDGKLAGSLDSGLVAQERLAEGMELSAERLAALTAADDLKRGMDAALTCLAYRPRSEHELATRLSRRGFSAETRQAVISRLRQQHLVDDDAFARFWQENRAIFSPRSRRLTLAELKQKGVPAEVLESLEVASDQENAQRAALSKARSLRNLDYDTFRRRLADYLRRRGFDYELIMQTVENAWKDGEGNTHPGNNEKEVNA